MEYANEIVQSRSRSRIRKRGIVTGFMKGMDHFDFTPYEGQLVRVNRDRVYLVKSGKGEYVSKLPLPDGRGWESVKEVTDKDDLSKKEKRQIESKVPPSIFASKTVKEGWKQEHPEGTAIQKVGNVAKVVAGALVAAPLVPVIGGLVNKITKPKDRGVSSVNAGGSPVMGNPIVTTSTTNAPTNSTLAEAILQKAQNAAPELKEKVIEKGQEYLTDTLGSVTRSPEMLPKTKKLKDAERYAEMGGYQEPNNIQGQSSLSMGFDPKYVMIGVALLLGAMFIFKSNS